MEISENNAGCVWCFQRRVNIFQEKKENKRLQLRSAQVEGRSYIYVQHVNLASFVVRPVHLRANNGAFCWRILANM